MHVSLSTYTPTNASGPTHIPNCPVCTCSASHAAQAIVSKRSSCRPSRDLPNVTLADSVTFTWKFSNFSTRTGLNGSDLATVSRHP
jgi:hypothetical protein